MTTFLTIFRRFLTTLQNGSEGQTNVPEYFPKFSEECRRFPKTFEEDPRMFRSYTNEFKHNLRNKLDVKEIIDIFTIEDMKNAPVLEPNPKL